MKSSIVKRTTRSIRSLPHDKSLQRSDGGMRGSSIAERQSEMSERKSLLQSKVRGHSKSAMKNLSVQPYQNFVKELKIKLPTPKQKFYQFLRIPPFNRNQNHFQLIAHFLKNVKFFAVHQPALLQQFAKKVKLLDGEEPNDKMMLVVLEGECYYDGGYHTPGGLVNRHPIVPEKLAHDPFCKLVYLNLHEYLSYLSTFVHQQLPKFTDFLNGIQTFKMFNQRVLQKFSENMSLHYFLKGQKLFRPNDQANLLLVVFSGKVSRKVIVEIEKINKIPTQKFTKILRIMNKSYEHQIQFFREDLIGVMQLVQNSQRRKEEIQVEQDSILLGIDRSIIQENMDDYVKDRFKKYNLKKYPANYDELCDNYLRTKMEVRKTEERKIVALKNELRNHQTDKRKEKIQEIIRVYQDNIKLEENKHLLEKKLQMRVVNNK